MVRMEAKVYRLTIDLTTRHVGEPEQFTFRIGDIIRSMDPDLEALWPSGPRQLSEQVRFHPLELPERFKSG
jgi:hypothetical protein